MFRVQKTNDECGTLVIMHFCKLLSILGGDLWTLYTPSVEIQCRTFRSFILHCKLTTQYNVGPIFCVILQCRNVSRASEMWGSFVVFFRPVVTRLLRWHIQRWSA